MIRKAIILVLTLAAVGTGVLWAYSYTVSGNEYYPFREFRSDRYGWTFAFGSSLGLGYSYCPLSNGHYLYHAPGCSNDPEKYRLLNFHFDYEPFIRCGKRSSVNPVNGIFMQYKLVSFCHIIKLFEISKSEYC